MHKIFLAKSGLSNIDKSLLRLGTHCLLIIAHSYSTVAINYIINTEIWGVMTIAIDGVTKKMVGSNV